MFGCAELSYMMLESGSGKFKEFDIVAVSLLSPIPRPVLLLHHTRALTKGAFLVADWP
jgi:hypothetical protein